MNFNKIKWMIGVAFVFLLILATNLIDQDNFEKVQLSIETIYEDRLVAQDILFELNTLIDKKDMANATLNHQFFTSENERVNTKINHLLSEYKATRLTHEEDVVYDQLKKEFLELSKIEPVSEDLTQSDQLEIEAQLNAIKQEFRRLVAIQLEEGKRAMDKSRKAIQSSKLCTQMEIWCLVILTIIFQLIIIFGPKKTDQAKE